MTRPAPQFFTADVEPSSYPEPEHGTWIGAETLWAAAIAGGCSVVVVLFALGVARLMGVS